jgi:hypothetical protein
VWQKSAAHVCCSQEKYLSNGVKIIFLWWVNASQFYLKGKRRFYAHQKQVFRFTHGPSNNAPFL